MNVKNPYHGAMITSAAMSGIRPAKYTTMSRGRSRQSRCSTVHHSIHAAVATERAVRTQSGPFVSASPIRKETARQIASRTKGNVPRTPASRCSHPSNRDPVMLGVTPSGRA